MGWVALPRKLKWGKRRGADHAHCTVLSFVKAPLASFCSSSELAVGCWNDGDAFCMRARFPPFPFVVAFVPKWLFKRES